MKKQLFLGFAILFLAAFSSNAALYGNYNGNGSIDLGGAVGNGTLTMDNAHSQFNATWHPGASLQGNLVIFFDNGSGQGITDTSGLVDYGYAAANSISGYSGGLHSTLNFGPNFHASYALVIMGDQTAGGLYSLINPDTGGMDGHLYFVRGNPGGQSSYYIGFLPQDIGLSSPSDSFRFVTSYTRDNGRRSFESFEDFVAGGSTAWGGTITFSRFDTFPQPVPEMTNAALAIFGGLACGAGVLGRIRRRLGKRAHAS